MSNDTLARVAVQADPKNPEGHAEAMAAKFDSRPKEPVADTTFVKPDALAEQPEKAASVSGDRPGWLPEEFETPEAFADAYKKLAEKPDQTKAPEKDPAGSEEKPAEGTPEEGATQKAEETLAKKGLDYGKYQSKYAEKGTLDETDYAELEAAGIPKSMVDDYVEGQKARADKFRSDVLSNVGGEDGYARLIGWAKTGLTAEEIGAFNEAVTGKSAAVTKLAVEGLNARYVAAMGNDPRLVRVSGAAAVEDRYESIAQMRKDMSSAEYRNDPAFRAKVARKLERSDIL